MAKTLMKQDITEREVLCYVGSDGLTVLSCPNCETTKAIDTNHKDYTFKTFKVKCKLGP